MRTTWLLIALAAILSGFACDTRQPTDAGIQEISITVTGTGTAQIWNIWDVYVDVDGDCEISPPDTQLDPECVGLGTTLATTVPWRYSAVLTVIRAGTTTEELIATSLGTSNEFSSVSFYDDTVIRELQDQCSGIPGNVLWTNGRQLTAAHKDVLEGCLQYSGLPPANVLGSPGAYTVEVGQGDTVIFRSRKARSNEGTSTPYNTISAGPLEQFAEVFVDGVSVVPQGDAATGSAEGGGISISTRIR